MLMRSKRWKWAATGNLQLVLSDASLQFLPPISFYHGKSSFFNQLPFQLQPLAGYAEPAHDHDHEHEHEHEHEQERGNGCYHAHQPDHEHTHKQEHERERERDREYDCQWILKAASPDSLNPRGIIMPMRLRLPT